MKLLRTNVRVNPRDPLGQGLDAVLTFVLFFVIGFFGDRWLGTTPWLMVVLPLVASVGLFYRLRAGYFAKMDQHDAERAERRAERAEPAAGAGGASPS